MRVGFAGANPLLVRPILHDFALKRTRSSGRKRNSGFYSVVNQFSIDDFSDAVSDAVRAAHPFHPAGCFECFGDTFGCRHPL